MNEQVEFGLNKASKAELAQHLLACDANFIPQLSYRVDIEKYAEKIAQSAMRFEAWFDGKLVGLVATYFNDKEKKCAFITSVSVLQEWGGRGLASQLMERCIKHAKLTNMKQLSLEVASNNHIAIKLYERNGFSASKAESSFISMNLYLTEG